MGSIRQLARVMGYDAAATLNPTPNAVKDLYKSRKLLNCPVFIGHTETDLIGTIFGQILHNSNLYAILDVERDVNLAGVSLAFDALVSSNTKEFVQFKRVHHLALTNSPVRTTNLSITMMEDNLRVVLTALKFGILNLDELLEEEVDVANTAYLKRKVVAAGLGLPLDAAALSDATIEELYGVVVANMKPATNNIPLIDLQPEASFEPLVEKAPVYAIMESQPKPSQTKRNRSF